MQSTGCPLVLFLEIRFVSKPLKVASFFKMTRNSVNQEWAGYTGIFPNGLYFLLHSLLN